MVKRDCKPLFLKDFLTNFLTTFFTFSPPGYHFFTFGGLSITNT